MKAIAQHLRSLFLLAIAIALMSMVAPSSGRAANVRFNRFTPLNIRPDVAVRGNGGGAVNVNVNGFGGVNVNGFGGFHGNAFRVNGFRSNVFVVPQPQAFFVSPNFVVPAGNFGVSSFGFQTFGVGGCGNCGGCFH